MRHDDLHRISVPNSLAESIDALRSFTHNRARTLRRSDCQRLAAWLDAQACQCDARDDVRALVDTLKDGRVPTGYTVTYR